MAQPANQLDIQNQMNQEPVRKEFLEMHDEFGYLVDEVIPHMKQHILDSGRPRSTPLNKFAYPPEILEKIG